MTIIRHDGTSTGQPSTPFFVAHDLTHFAIEAALGMRQAFYGLIREGWDIDAFAEKAPGSRKIRALPEEAIVAEHLVGLLDVQRAQRTLFDEEICSQLTNVLQDRNLSPFDISPTQVEEIRETRDRLLTEWTQTPTGETMELVFPE